MAVFISQIPKNLTEYPNSFKRQGSFPLEAYSVFSSLEAAETYAKSNPIAYVGQPLAVTLIDVKTEGEGDEAKETVIERTYFYVIGNQAGDLLCIGDSSINATEIDRRLKAVEEFFDVIADSGLEGVVDTLKELQDYISKDIEDFTNLHKDVKDIYTPATPEHTEGDTVIPATEETGILIDKEKQLRKEIETIYKPGREAIPEDIENGTPGAPAIEPSGLLVDEEAARIDSDRELGNRIDEIYDADGGLADDGETKIPSGLLVEEATKRAEEDQKILDKLLGTNANKENGEFYNVADGILAGIRGAKDENGNYEYNNIVEYIQGSIPVATENQLGRVLSSKAKDAVSVDSSGVMTVNSLNVNKLYQTDYLIIDGGTATQVTFQQEQQEPTLSEV